MQNFEHIKREVAQVAEANGALLAFVFGSYARGTATERSDLDVLIVEKTSRPFLKRIDQYFDPLFDRLKIGIEVLVYTPGELENIKHRPFIRTAIEEGVLVYESGKESTGSKTVAETGQK